MRDRYFCSQCGLESSSIFETFLHIFTTHLHVDIGLSQEESKRLLSQTRPLKVRL